MSILFKFIEEHGKQQPQSLYIEFNTKRFRFRVEICDVLRGKVPKREFTNFTGDPNKGSSNYETSVSKPFLQLLLFIKEMSENFVDNTIRKRRT